ncbi:MAG UNVERIFIED_CONTAM: hypothetical protein LVR18_24140 [Planctomycetaceae bacterium]|jgi:hypothetical protein
MAGLFVYQLECIARNRLGYGRGLDAMAADPVYSSDWSRWILRIRGDLGTLELAELVYRVSEHFYSRRTAGRPTGHTGEAPERGLVLFGEQEGRIARANIGRDPLYLFAALQRHLGYPAVPRTTSTEATDKLPGFLEARLQKIEQRLKILDMESKGGLDLSRFYKGVSSRRDSEQDCLSQLVSCLISCAIMGARSGETTIPVHFWVRVIASARFCQRLGGTGSLRWSRAVVSATSARVSVAGCGLFP